MEPTGKLSALNERLRLKMESDRAEIEALTKSALETLARNLKSESEHALNSIAANFHETTQKFQEQNADLLWRIGRTAQKQKLWTLLSGSGALALSVSILIGLWVFTGWQKSELESYQSLTENERNVLAQLKNQTGGVKFFQPQGGSYLVLPKGTDLKSTYTCPQGTCLKLGN